MTRRHGRPRTHENSPRCNISPLERGEACTLPIIWLFPQMVSDHLHAGKEDASVAHTDADRGGIGFLRSRHHRVCLNLASYRDLLYLAATTD